MAIASGSGTAAQAAPAIEIGDHPREAMGYATMGERFLAFLCDGSVGTLLIGAFLALFYRKSLLDFDVLKQIALWVIPAAYMTVCEVLFHRTLGKWLLRIQVRRDSPEPRYPSPLKILIRESIGKFLSGLVLGIGFLAGAWNAKKKTWADQMAGTVVVRTGRATPRIKALLVPVLIVINVWLSVVMAEIPSRLGSNIVQELAATEGRVDDVHERIFQVVFVPAPQTINEYQQEMKALVPALDEYDRLLAEEKKLVERLEKLSMIKYMNDEVGYEKLLRWRGEIVRTVRRQVQTVLAFDAQKQSWDDLLKARHEIMGEMNRWNNYINQFGGKYVVKKTATEKPARGTPGSPTIDEQQNQNQKQIPPPRVGMTEQQGIGTRD